MRALKAVQFVHEIRESYRSIIVIPKSSNDVVDKCQSCNEIARREGEWAGHGGGDDLEPDEWNTEVYIRVDKGIVDSTRL
jgi:hypothetical protein